MQENQNIRSLLSETVSIYSISELNEIVRRRLQTDPSLRSLWIEGELSNLRKIPSGHIYFSLKDKNAQLRCTFFRGSNASHASLALQDGMQVLAFGSVGIYVARGEYQFNVQRLMLAGEGELQLRVEALRKKLREEGLFDQARKKALPYLPLTLGIATASTGAAINDILRIAWSRYPNLHVLLAPCSVQGEEAPASIIHALGLLERSERKVDLIIVGRGGGSFEDLMAFNDEGVLRAIAACPIPIVSAVGHDIDHPLSDLAADHYAPTPSAAAAQVIPDKGLLLEKIEDNEVRIQVELKRRYIEGVQNLDSLLASSVHIEPRSILEGYWRSLEVFGQSLKQSSLLLRQTSLRKYERFAYEPRLYYEKKVHDCCRHFGILYERLQNFSPLATLRRGYSITRKQKGDIVRSYKELSPGETIEVLLAEGSLLAELKAAKKFPDPVI